MPPWEDARGGVPRAVRWCSVRMTPAPAAAATATGGGPQPAEVALLPAAGAGGDGEELLDLGPAAGGTGDPRVTPHEGVEVGDRRLDGALQRFPDPLHRVLRPEGVAGTGHDLERRGGLPVGGVQSLRFGGGDAVVLLTVEEEPGGLHLAGRDLEVEPVP